MKVFIRPLFIISFLLTPVIAASTSREFSFMRESACDSEHDPYGPNKITAEHKKRNLLVTGWVSVNCASILVNPSITHDRNSITINVDTPEIKPDQPIAACNCTEKFTMTINRKVASGTVINLTVRGHQSAKVAVP
jgi:hypothetical protein